MSIVPFGQEGPKSSHALYVFQWSDHFKLIVEPFLSGIPGNRSGLQVPPTEEDMIASKTEAHHAH